MELLVLLAILIVFYFVFRNAYEYAKLPEESELITTDEETGEKIIDFGYAYKYSDLQIAEVISRMIIKGRCYNLKIGAYNTKDATGTLAIRSFVEAVLAYYREEEKTKFGENMDFKSMVEEILLSEKICVVDSYIKVAWIKFGNDFKYRKKMKKCWLDMYDNHELPLSLCNSIIKSMYSWTI